MSATRSLAIAAALVCSFTVLQAGAAAAPPERSIDLPAGPATPAGRYLIALPASGGGGAPLLVALHGAASSPEAVAALTGLTSAATAAGVAVALPASAGVVWNDGRGSEPGFADLTPRNDVAFLEAVVNDAVKRFGVDASRVSVVGLGSGGSMALQLGCRRPAVASSLVVVNASLWDYQRRACASSGLPSLLLIHGDDDPRTPWDGRSLQAAGVDARSLGVDGTLAYWGGRLGCTGAPEPASAVSMVGGCPTDRFAASVRVAGGGGTWPTPDRAVTVAGKRESALGSTDLDATAVAVAVAGGRPWRALLPSTPHRTAPGPARSFDVYLPPGYDPSEPVPLVVMVHGRGDSGYGMAALTGMNAVADAHGFAVAYPESRGDSWNFYEGVPGVVPSEHVSDLTFLRRLVERIALDVPLDRRRIYLAGFSNGGFMTERAACALSDEFAAFAVVSAEMLPELAFNCDVTPTAPILLMHGTSDTDVPWDGIIRQQQGARRYATLPVPQSVTYWTLRNVCPFLPQQDQLPDGSDGATHVVRFRYLHCAFGRDVWFYAIQGGGHNWPGGAPLLPAKEAGNVTTAIRASDEIWSFFAAYPLDARRSRSPLSDAP